MNVFRIHGGTPLYGSVRLGGAKNASFKLMIASLLSKGESRLLNFSHISEVDSTAKIISSLGGQAKRCGERTMFINPRHLGSHAISSRFGPASRSAPMFIPALLHRFGKAIVPLPGGDKIGQRPLDRHFEGLVHMGADISITDGFIHVHAPRGLSGTEYTFTKNTHTGTETLIMAAVLASGPTLLHNAALEPEVDDLIHMLVQMGADIRRLPHRRIQVQGVASLKPTIYQIMPDRNEAVSYAVAALATKGDIIVENASKDHLSSFLEQLDIAGGGYDTGNYGIRFYYKKPLTAVDITTQPHPGFMTDWQPLWAVLATQSRGISTIHETIYPDRFQYCSQLSSMGADVTFFTPPINDPDQVYNFNYDQDSSPQPHAIKITGPTPLKPCRSTVKDLRHGATLVIAAIIANGTSHLKNVDQIDRGYEDLDTRLRSMGANITRYQTGKD